MLIVLTKEDFSALSASTRAELLSSLSAKPKMTADGFPEGFNEGDYNVVDLSPGDIEYFMEGCADETIAGLRILAENGPVIHASLLDAAGIENYGHFQGRVTKRTRTVTKEKDAYLFAWDNWQEAPDGVGSYAVTQETFRSLRIFFKID